MPTRSPSQPERYEPLPGLFALPGWLWRKIGRSGRVVALVALVAALATAAALTPSILESKNEQASSERAERAELRAELARRLRAEQRPRFRQSASVEPRAALMDEMSAEILADARGRVARGRLDGPIRRVTCEPFPRTVDGVGADQDLSRRTGRYSCIAVTAEFARGETSIGGVIGHQYRSMVDFKTGRYAFCKISGQAGPSREQLATTPEACGGR